MPEPFQGGFVLFLFAVLQAAPRQQFPAVNPPGAGATVATAVKQLCLSPYPNDRTALLRYEELLADTVSTKPTPERLADLGCIRANLHEADAIGHEGYMMPMGASWSDGALLVLTKSVTAMPNQARAAGVLALLALQANEPDHIDRITDAIRASVLAGVATPAVLRACADLSLRAKDGATARKCVTRALATGNDSTWHLVRLAQLAFREADTVSGARWFERALAAAHDSAAREEVNWHLQWFLSPAEQKQSATIADAARGEWVRDRLAERDVRDGRPAGARLAEHFGRVEYVMAHFALHIGHVIANNPRGFVGTTPQNDLGPDLLRAYCEPAVVPAQPYRDYTRWQNRIDDRGVVWLRFGAPIKRIPASVTCGKPDPKTGVLIANVREGWLYEIDGKPMVLNFESEIMSGSVEATRLVTGVLGSYLCGLDALRCRLTEISIAAWKGAASPVQPQEVEHVRQLDREFISVATTKDDNSPRGGKNISLVSRLSRLWDPISGASFALVTYALPVKDLLIQGSASKRTTLVDMELRQWDPVADRWRDTSFSHHFVVPDTNAKRPSLVGFFTVPSTPSVTAWSLVTTQPDERHGRAYDVSTPGLPNGPVVLSDLVLGAEVQGLIWSLHNVEIPLAPVNAVDRTTVVSLYYQIKSDEPRSGLRTTVALYKVEDGVAKDSAALQVSYDQGVRSGINEVAPTLDVSRLDNGTYALEVRLTDSRGTVLARRRVMLDLQ